MSIQCEEKKTNATSIFDRRFQFLSNDSSDTMYYRFIILTMFFIITFIRIILMIHDMNDFFKTKFYLVIIYFLTQNRFLS